ncbi:MAG TPA: energy transducer TonB [Thermoanaerobaculia bacterium]|jgi:protein TonB|nr:energy transducer TonB [Thermoanaerobaculia bacterium]
MDLQNQLLESGKQHLKGGWKATLASLGVHGAIIGLILFLSMQATQKVAAEDKPIRAYLSSKAAPPPPPPPPPPAASHASSSPKVVKPVQVTHQTFVQPREIPKEVPKVDIPTPTTKVAEVDTTPAEPSNDPPGAQEGGVAGGVVGGVVGGQQGGTVGGEVGGQIGGVLGGEKGGVVGGTVGGTGTTGTEGDKPASPEPKDEGPLRVGGDVKAPVATERVKPDYTDAARKAHINGVVIVEAIVNKQGEVEQVKVLKGLPLGLSEQATEAVKRWHFRPGTLNGEPVEVIFSLTVNFTLQ